MRIARRHPPVASVHGAALLVFSIVLACLAVPAPAAAQEAQVPLDEAGELLEIDRGLAQRLGLFLDEYPGLQVVRLYELADGSYVLEVTVRADGRTLRQRVPLTADEVRALRARVGAALTARAPEATLDQDGRFLLLGTTTLLGLGFYGWAVPAALDIDSGRGVLASYMLTAGASFVLPYLYTRTRPVTYGMANAGFWGSTRGVLHGLYLAFLLDDNAGGGLAPGLGVAASVAEGLVFYDWARSNDVTAGHAHTLGNHGDFGHNWAGSVLMMAQPDAEELAYAGLLLGSGIGLAYGAARAPTLPYTWGDAEVQRLAFHLGAANGAVVWDWILGDNPDDDDIRVLGAALLAGSIVGLRAGERALDGHDFSAGQAILVDLGTIAGGLLGAGLAVLASPEDSGDATSYLTLAAIGANLGFLATFASLSDDARQRADRRAGALDLQLNPGALLLLSPDHPLRDAAPALEMPLLSVRIRF